MKKFTSILVLLLSVTSFANPVESVEETYGQDLSEMVNPFSSDGCSRWPDGIPFLEGDEWLDCCFEHDKAYWMGGTRLEREQKDLELRQCVAEQFGVTMGFIMFVGVNIGGAPKWGTSYRWGYGWKDGRSYTPLTEEEIEFRDNGLPGPDADPKEFVCDDVPLPFFDYCKKWKALKNPNNSLWPDASVAP